jgi:hypothetical protein
LPFYQPAHAGEDNPVAGFEVTAHRDNIGLQVRSIDLDLATPNGSASINQPYERSVCGAYRSARYDDPLHITAGKIGGDNGTYSKSLPGCDKTNADAPRSG